MALALGLALANPASAIIRRTQVDCKPTLLPGVKTAIPTMDADPERLFTTLRFTIQVAHRNHLAAVMRGMRHIPEVTRITRERGGEA